MIRRLQLGLLATILAVTGPLAQADGHAAHALAGEFEGGWLAKVKGTWTIVQENDKWLLKTGPKFKADKGPDVKVFLSKQAADDISGSNATEQAAFVVLLDKFKGEQTIELPAGIDPKDYQSLVFHCEEYSKLWGATELR